MHFSMVYADAEEDGDDAPYYPDLINMAHALVRNAVDKLDSVYRRPVVERLKRVIKTHRRGYNSKR